MQIDEYIEKHWEEINLAYRQQMEREAELYEGYLRLDPPMLYENDSEQEENY